MEIEARVFDHDGVIADSMKNLHFNHISKHIPDMPFEEWIELSNGNYWAEAEKSKYASRLAAIRDKPDFQDYIKNHITVPLYQGIPELIIELKQKGYKIGLNTSGSNEQVLGCLEHNNILNAFDFLGTKDVSTSKEEKLLLSCKGAPNKD